MCLLGIESAFAMEEALPSKATTAKQQKGLSAAEALKSLKEGNQRFRNNALRNDNYQKEMKITTQCVCDRG